MDFVFLNSVDWLVIKSTGEYTMLGIGRKHRALIVEPFQSWITALRVARTQARSLGRRRSGVWRQDHVYVYTPPRIGLPGASRWRWPAAINAWVFSWLLRRVLRQLAMTDPVVYTYAYDAADVIRRLPARLRVYECLDSDETLARDERHRLLVREREEQTCKGVDLVIAITEELAAPRRAWNPNTHAVNGGVELEFYGRGAMDSTVVPEDIARLPHPVLGYLGGLDPWKMDVELLKHLAVTHPEWSIALVGFVWYGFDPRRFEPCTNIHVLGPKPYNELPAYVKGMDVCLMPFPLNGITRNGDAIKMYEYLAAGKPVVSVPVPAALRNRDVVRIASTKDEFVQAVEDSLLDGEDERARRLASVRTKTWSHRVEQKLDLISSTLRPRTAGSSPKVTVILPAYNAAAYLAQSIGSVLGQSFQDFELLVLDNASTDNTAEVAARFTGPRVRFVRHDRNYGFAGNLGRGIALARGEYVTAIGADDIWSSNFLEKTVAFLDAHPRAGMVHTDALWIDAAGHPFGESAAGWRTITPPRDAVVDCFRRGFCFATVVWRAETLQRAGGFEEHWDFTADLPLFLRLCLHGDTGFIAESLVWYRHHPENLSTEMFAGRGGGLFRVCTDMLETARSWPGAAGVITPAVRRRARRHIALLAIRMLHLTRLQGSRLRWLRGFGEALGLAPELTLLPFTWSRFGLGLLPRGVIVKLQRWRHAAAARRYRGLAPDEQEQMVAAGQSGP